MTIELKIENDTFLVEVVRSQRRHNSVALRYIAHNNFVLSVPVDTSEKWIRDFLEKRRSWIKKILRKPVLPENIKPIVPGCSAATEYYRVFVVENTEVRFPQYKIVQYNADKKTLFKVSPEFFSAEHCGQLYQILEKHLLVESMKAGAPELIQRAQRYADQHQIAVKEIFVKIQKSRLGYCTHDKRIMLNARLFFAPQKIRDYVIHHELAHTRYHNHSRQFWQYLEEIFPGAKATDKLLRDPTLYSMKVIPPEAE